MKRGDACLQQGGFPVLVAHCDHAQFTTIQIVPVSFSSGRWEARSPSHPTIPCSVGGMQTKVTNAATRLARFMAAPASLSSASLSPWARWLGSSCGEDQHP